MLNTSSEGGWRLSYGNRRVNRWRGIGDRAAEGPNLSLFPVNVFLGSPNEVVQPMTSLALQVIPQGGSSSYSRLKGHELLAVFDPFCPRRFILEAFEVCL